MYQFSVGEGLALVLWFSRRPRTQYLGLTNIAAACKKWSNIDMDDLYASGEATRHRNCAGSRWSLLGGPACFRLRLAAVLPAARAMADGDRDFRPPLYIDLP